MYYLHYNIYCIKLYQAQRPEIMWHQDFIFDEIAADLGKIYAEKVFELFSGSEEKR